MVFNYFGVEIWFSRCIEIYHGYQVNFTMLSYLHKYLNKDLSDDAGNI